MSGDSMTDCRSNAFWFAHHHNGVGAMTDPAVAETVRTNGYYWVVAARWPTDPPEIWLWDGVFWSDDRGRRLPAGYFTVVSLHWVPPGESP